MSTTPLAAIGPLQAALLAAVAPARLARRESLALGGGRVEEGIQRRVLGHLRSHPAACGFERGRGIVDNAAPHVGRAVAGRGCRLDTGRVRILRRHQRQQVTGLRMVDAHGEARSRP